MREIKFRAWDKKLSKMIFTGFHVTGEVTAFGLIESHIFENKCGAESSLERWNDIVLMQFTGLKDKNGEEIYEVDIVEVDIVDVPDYCGVIYYSEESGQFKHKVKHTECGLFQGFGKIIGNIYENPELLA